MINWQQDKINKIDKKSQIYQMTSHYSLKFPKILQGNHKISLIYNSSNLRLRQDQN